MQHALLAVIIVCPLLGFTGTLVVNNRMAFFAESIAHASLAGLAAGFVLGFDSPRPVMLAFAALFAAALVGIRRVSSGSTDTLIGVCSATAVAFGLVLLTRGGRLGRATPYLFGDLLSITPADLAALTAAALAVLAVWLLFFNRLFAATFVPALARPRGLRTGWYELILAIVLAELVTLALPWVGLLIINALLVLPAAAARHLAGSLRAYHLLAAGSGLVCGVAGLVTSYYAGTATGATIVLFAAAWFALTLLPARSRR